jgi:hypothetical protein
MDFKAGETAMPIGIAQAAVNLGSTAGLGAVIGTAASWRVEPAQE